MSGRDEEASRPGAAQAPRGRALTGLRVLDVSGSVATSYCAKLFADEGAEVINVEPPAGFATRGLPPFVPGAEPPEHSAMHRYLQANKASIVLDPAVAADHARLEALLRRADVVIDAVHQDDAMFRTLAVEQLQRLRPGIVRTSITWFGQNSPYAEFTGSDAVCQALAGLIRTIGPVEGPPLLPTGYQAGIVAGTSAFIGTLGYVLGRELANSTAVVHIDTAVLEANLCFTEVGAVGAHVTGMAAPRMGINRFPPTYPLGIYRCRDGWLGVTALTPPQWQAFCSLLGMVDEAREPRYGSSLQRLADAPVLDPVIASRLREHSARELFERGQAMRIPLAPVPTMAELFTTDQYVRRGAFADVTHDDGHRFLAPVAPFRLSRSPSLVGGHVARLGADDERVLAELESQAARPPAGTGNGRAAIAPLRGIRVLDLSMGWAGPLATRHLSDLGAEIIKVESCQHTDWWRGFEPTAQWIEEHQAEKSVSFNTMNRNKLDVTLDLTKDAGKQLLKRLAAMSDAVIENYSGAVLQKLGLDYATLRAVNDELLMLSMPAFGSTGDWAHYRAYGSTVEQASGLPHLHGRDGDPPAMLHVAYGDAVAGLNAAAALLLALRHRERSGAGQHLDLSQSECLFPLGAHGIVEQAVTGRAPPRLGNRSARAVPHGVYPCAGEDAWIVVQVFDENQWQRLQSLVGDELRGFGDAADRRAQEDRLDAALAAWTSRFEPDALMHKLQAESIPAGAVRSALDLVGASELEARGFWQWCERAYVGRQPQPSAPYRTGPGPIPVGSPAPTLGEHNIEVLCGLLGLSHAELAELEAQQIIGHRPVLPSSSGERYGIATGHTAAG